MDSYTKDCLELLKRMRNYRAVKLGKEGYDFDRAKREDPVIRELCDRNMWVSDNLSRIAYEMKRRIAKDGIAVIEPEDDPLGIVWKKDVFGNVKQWEQIRNEIRCLVLAGKTLADHERRLQRKYHLYPDQIQKPGKSQADRNLLVKEYWGDIAAEYANMSEREKSFELEYRRNAGLCGKRMSRNRNQAGKKPQKGGQAS